jgi:hypothetical protein
MNNGCGPGWLPYWIKELLFNWFFEASCNVHDEGYREGGDETRRALCDYKFWLAMRRDTLRQRDIQRLLRWLQALVFYALVRLFGWTRFNYTPAVK